MSNLMRPELKLRWLNCFLFVAETGSLVWAAGLLEISPQTLKKNLYEFEQFLKKNLFEFDGDDVFLSSYAQSLYFEIESLFQQVQNLAAECSRAATARTLLIASSSRFLEPYLVLLGPVLKILYPGRALVFQYFSSCIEVFQAIQQKECDLGLTFSDISGPSCFQIMGVKQHFLQGRFQPKTTESYQLSLSCHNEKLWQTLKRSPQIERILQNTLWGETNYDIA